MTAALVTIGRRGARAVCAGVLLLLAAIAPAAAVPVQRVSGEGVEAWLIEDRSQPVIAVSLAFRGGAALEPADRLGLAAMTMALLGEGAGELDAAAFQGRLEDIAADIRFSADQDTLTVSLRTLSEHRDEALALLALALTRPRFDAEAIERVRSQMLASLKRRAADPDDVANRRFFGAMFPDHPYGRPVDGTPETLAAVTRGDIAAFASARLARSALVIGVAGDITAAQLAPLLARTFGALPAAAAAAEIARAVPAASGTLAIVDVPARQSSVMFGQPGLLRDDPRFYALTVVNQVLGGSGLNSRLFTEVREKRGLAYSIYTNPLPYRHGALWAGGAGTANERVAETLTVIRDQWQRLQSGGLTQAELDDAKTYLIGSFPLRLTSTGRLAGILVSMQLQDLGIDWLDRRNALIAAVTLNDANTLAASLVDPGKLVFVVAGQPARLTE
ncbi:MAG: insulinase family protein [Rhodospirillales bacterium]|nr:insulinase family protein [Rhodospirillales bacterium]